MTENTSRDERGAVLTIGFGTAVAMWAVGYVTHLPGLAAPAPLTFLLMLAAMLAGGLAVGRYTGFGISGGVRAGLLTAVINMLILGSLLGGDRPGSVVPAAALWIPGALLFGAVVGGVGALLGGRSGTRPLGEPFWRSALIQVAAAATLLLVAVGGLVTSWEAGLAVVDWPNSFGYNMFLYPLSRMTGGVYYEHAHRLFGALVGLTTVCLTLHLWRVEPRRWVRWATVLASVLVVVQGILGGLRVTGRFTMSQLPEAMQPSLELALAHGILGQVFLSLLVALAAFTSRSWCQARAVAERGARLDRWLSKGLVAVLVLQLVLGALVRHMASGVALHVTLAMIATGVGLAAGFRGVAIHADRAMLRRLGAGLLVVFPVQLVLGVLALVTTSVAGSAGQPGWADVLVATAHQLTGAVLLGLSVLLACWSHRLLAPAAKAPREQRLRQDAPSRAH
jgi:cytochrome c oxidase assembly protein subunit 15